MTEPLDDRRGNDAGGRREARRGGVRRHGTGTAAQAAAAKRTRMHPIEAARMFHALEDPPRRTQADISRETGKSPAYVSILCRVGEAVHELTSEERDALRRPHLTYTALAALVARHRDRGALLAAIQALAARPPQPRRTGASGGTSVWTRRAPADPSEAPIDPLPAPRGAVPRGLHGTFTYIFDAAAWRADPFGAFDALDAHLRETLEGVMRRALRALGADHGPLPLTPPAGRPSASPRASRDQRELAAALEVSLRRLDATLRTTNRGHRAHLAAFDAERAAAKAARDRSGPGAASLPDAEDPVTPDEIDADPA